MSAATAGRVALWIAALAVAFLAPRAFEPIGREAERILRAFASRRLLCCLGIFLFVLVARLAVLPLRGIPKPAISDEFGYLLQADTFSQFRLTNPPHPLWEFFEDPHLLQHPTYNAKFPPGQGLMLAVGQILTGEPWFGVWLSCGLLAAALCWALQGWFTPGWALLGSAVALPLCVSSYWMDSYWGGSVAAAGAALVLGAIPRMKRPQPSFVQEMLTPAILAFGSIVVMFTRPFEGLLVLFPIFVYLIAQRLPAKSWTIVAIVGVAGAAWLGYYNYRVTGNPLRLPYVEYDRQYPSTGHLNILPLPRASTFRNLNMMWNDAWERRNWAISRSARFPILRFEKLAVIATTFLGSAVLILPILFFLPSLVANPKFRALWWAVLLTGFAACTEVVYTVHYAAPVLAVLLILTVQALRHLRAWSYEGKPVGRTLGRLSILALMVFWLGKEAFHLAQGQAAGEIPQNAHRVEVEAELEGRGGAHVIIVRYPPSYQGKTDFEIHADWNYNHADMDNAPVIWAHDLGPQENRRLLEYYNDRTIWVMSPDESYSHLDLYPSAP